MIWLYWAMVGTGLGLMVHLIFSTKPTNGVVGSVLMSTIGAVIGGLLGRSLFNLSSFEMFSTEATVAVAVGSLSMLALNALMAR